MKIYCLNFIGSADTRDRKSAAGLQRGRIKEDKIVGTCSMSEGTTVFRRRCRRRERNIKIYLKEINMQ
jgi:hypothetical protein